MLFRCRTCKIELSSSAFSVRSDNKRLRTECNKCRTAYTIKWGKAHPAQTLKNRQNHIKTEKFKSSRAKYRMTDNARFLMGVRQAKKRNLEWSLTRTQYAALVDHSCHYCAGSLGLYGTNLDRKDNGEGYTIDNSVACCGSCNRTKGDRLTYIEMVAVANLLKEMRRG